MFLRTSTLILLVFAANLGFGQNENGIRTDDTTLILQKDTNAKQLPEINFQIKGDKDILKLLKTDIHLKRKGISNGWRLQILFHADREKVKVARNNFVKKFPEIPAYLIYNAPYFKLVVGNYKTKSEANIAQQIIAKDFKSYPVQSEIRQ